MSRSYAGGIQKNSRRAEFKGPLERKGAHLQLKIFKGEVCFKKNIQERNPVDVRHLWRRYPRKSPIRLHENWPAQQQVGAACDACLLRHRVQTHEGVQRWNLVCRQIEVSKARRGNN